jgi:hypothetical protein
MRSSKATNIARQEHQPDSLYLLAADLLSKHDDTPRDIIAPRPFLWSDVTSVQIESHMRPQPMLAHTSPFLSAHIDPSRALEFLALDYRERTSRTATNIVRINARALVPAWAYAQNDDKIPVWIEQGKLPQLPKGVLSMTTKGFDAFESSFWICIDEVRELLNIDDDVGVGQWLACGKVPSRLIHMRDGAQSIGEGLGMRAEAAGRSIVVHKRAHKIPRNKVPLRTSSLPLAATKEERGDVEKKHTTEPGPSLEGEEQGEVFEPTEHREATQTLQATNVTQNQRNQHSEPPPLPPHSPHRPQRIPPFSEHSHDSSILVPPPLQIQRSTIKSQNSLPDCIAVRDFACVPAIILTPPTPQPQLLYSAIAIRSPRSYQSAATLARLEDVQLRGAALNMWMEEIRQKQQGYRETEAKKKADARKEMETDIWSENRI